ncbi:hypothetical protein Tco_1550092, partial [Tanacetum coccineum]
SAKKQSSVAMSSAEAEYVAATRCCAQVLWIKSQLDDYDALYDKKKDHTKYYCYLSLGLGEYSFGGTCEKSAIILLTYAVYFTYHVK